MGRIISAIKSPLGMFVVGMVAGVVVDRRTGGKITAIIAKIPTVGPMVLG